MYECSQTPHSTFTHDHYAFMHQKAQAGNFSPISENNLYQNNAMSWKTVSCFSCHFHQSTMATPTQKKKCTNDRKLFRTQNFDHLPNTSIEMGKSKGLCVPSAHVALTQRWNCSAAFSPFWWSTVAHPADGLMCNNELEKMNLGAEDPKLQIHGGNRVHGT